VDPGCLWVDLRVGQRSGQGKWCKKPFKYNTIWIATALIVAFHALQGVVWMAQSWDAVTERTIVNCWRKCKILPIEWSGSSLDPFDSQLQNEGVELDGLIGHLGLGDNTLSAKRITSSFPMRARSTPS
jgi:hypothetical protein